MTLEFDCRLVNTFFSDANLHIGWHWDPAALARWTSMMPCSSRLGLRIALAAQDDLVQELVMVISRSSLSFDKGNVGNVITLVAGGRQLQEKFWIAG